MSQQLINHSPDLKRLRDEGYEVAIYGGYLLIHHIPYVNNMQQIRYGTLVSTLTLSGNKTTTPDNHVIYFIGEHPCNKDGTIITAIQHASHRQQMDKAIIIDHSFSNKPPAGYPDYFEKVSTYVKIISSPAHSLDRTVTAKTFKVPEDESEESAFHYPDTNSSRAKINMLNDRFKGLKIAIVGLGGTGAYVLDLVAKTEVSEIHIFDGDEFLQHNAFRSPGAASIKILDSVSKKVDVYRDIYSNMHKHILPHAYYLGESNLNELNEMSYVFICVDKNSVRKELIAHLLKRKIPFIDVGLGVETIDNVLIGALRVTTGTFEKNEHLSFRVATEDAEDDAYSSNIQIADLNMLNASLAVVKWKKMVGFYLDLIKEHNSSYTINTGQLENTDTTA